MPPSKSLDIKLLSTLPSIILDVKR